MSMKTYFIYLAIMAGVTYLIRAVPFAAIEGKINNKFIKSFLAYIPYTVLAAMTFPAILTATASYASAVAALIVAVILAYFDKGLIKVALSSCAVAFIVEFLMQYL